MNCKGLLHIGTCFFDAPVILSFPHFFKACDKVQKQVQGLNPNADKHDIVVYFEPVSNHKVDSFDLIKNFNTESDVRIPSWWKRRCPN